jgi:hypothetical protein
MRLVCNDDLRRMLHATPGARRSKRNPRATLLPLQANPGELLMKLARFADQIVSITKFVQKRVRMCDLWINGFNSLTQSHLLAARPERHLRSASLAAGEAFRVLRSTGIEPR